MLPIVIRAGGLATRLYPRTLTLPKSLIPIAGKPFIHHQLQLFKRNKIEKIIICCGKFGEAIKEYVKDGS